MPGPSLHPVFVPLDVRAKLVRTARSATAAYRDRERAMIIVLASQGVPNAQIARRIGAHEDTVRRWRRRFAEDPRVESLRDQRRSGRPPRVAPEVRANLVKLACQRPSGSNEHRALSFRDLWTYQALADALFAETGERISTSEVGRILRSNALRPHRVRMWLHSPDPRFVEKVRTICGLYRAPPEDTVVLCMDEKSLAVRADRFPMRPAGRGRAARRDFEYVRHGTAVLLAAFNTRTGELFGQVRVRRTASDLEAFMDEVARHYQGKKVIVIWDNLNIHHEGKSKRWTRFNRRWGKRFTFVYTPIHASWTNQVEVWFSILERRILRHASYESLGHIAERVEDFIDHWNDHEAHPFRWTFRGEMDPANRRAA